MRLIGDITASLSGSKSAVCGADTQAGARDMQTADCFLLEREFLMRIENLQNETSVARDPARGDAGQL